MRDAAAFNTGHSPPAGTNSPSPLPHKAHKLWDHGLMPTFTSWPMRGGAESPSLARQSRRRKQQRECPTPRPILPHLAAPMEQRSLLGHRESSIDAARLCSIPGHTGIGTQGRHTRSPTPGIKAVSLSWPALQVSFGMLKVCLLLPLLCFLTHSRTLENGFLYPCLNSQVWFRAWSRHLAKPQWCWLDREHRSGSTALPGGISAGLPSGTDFT